MEGYIAIKEAAKVAKLSPERIRMLCRKEKIEATRIGHIWAVNLESLTEWANSEARARGRRMAGLDVPK